eukprot:6177174-Pleurochrysis_carterae.AAC.2
MVENPHSACTVRAILLTRRWLEPMLEAIPRPILANSNRKLTAQYIAGKLKARVACVLHESSNMFRHLRMQNFCRRIVRLVYHQELATLSLSARAATTGSEMNKQPREKNGFTNQIHDIASLQASGASQV